MQKLSKQLLCISKGGTWQSE